MPKSKYCSEYEESIEKLLDETLAEISDELSNSDIAPNLDFVVLGGGYGRGEGGILRMENRPPYLYNDLDFFVISKTDDKSVCEAIDKFFASLGKKWTDKLKIDVDFGAAKSANYISKRLDIQMWREMILGANVIFGGQDRFDSIFKKNLTKPLPPREFAKLMFNRNYGLFLADEKISAIENPSEEDFDFIARNINKSILACGETVLAKNNIYKFSTPDRLEALQNLDLKDFVISGKMKSLYASAFEFKKNPSPSQDIASQKEKIAEVKKLAIAVLEYSNDFFKAYEGLAPSIKNAKKNLSTRKLFKSLGVSTYLFLNPMISGVGVIKNFFKSNGKISKSDSDNLKNIWLKIN